MALTLGKSFNRQIKLRLPFQKYFYDISVFYTTKINFNLFDIKPIMKYNTFDISNNVKINMFKNIEMSEFCMNCLNLEYDENTRPLKYVDIVDNWKSSITCESVDNIIMSDDNYIKIYLFKIKDFDKDFLFLLIERRNYFKENNNQILTTLSGVQISISEPIDMIRDSIKLENQCETVEKIIPVNEYINFNEINNKEQ